MLSVTCGGDSLNEHTVFTVQSPNVHVFLRLVLHAAFPDIYIKAKNHFHFNMNTIVTVKLLYFIGKQQIALPKYILLSPFFQAHDNSVKNDRNDSNRLRYRG